MFRCHACKGIVKWKDTECRHCGEDFVGLSPEDRAYLETPEAQQMSKDITAMYPEVRDLEIEEVPVELVIKARSLAREIANDYRTCPDCNSDWLEHFVFMSG